jgi:hypothetical protein
MMTWIEVEKGAKKLWVWPARFIRSRNVLISQLASLGATKARGYRLRPWGLETVGDQWSAWVAR